MNLRSILCLSCLVCVSAATFAAEKCYHSSVDPSWNRNDNKPGTACHRQVAKVRKLEFDPKFDCSKAIRQEWQRELDIANKMGCKT